MPPFSELAVFAQHGFRSSRSEPIDVFCTPACDEEHFGDPNRFRVAWRRKVLHRNYRGNKRNMNTRCLRGSIPRPSRLDAALHRRRLSRIRLRQRPQPSRGGGTASASRNRNCSTGVFACAHVGRIRKSDAHESPTPIVLAGAACRRSNAHKRRKAPKDLGSKGQSTAQQIGSVGSRRVQRIGRPAPSTGSIARPAGHSTICPRSLAWYSRISAPTWIRMRKPATGAIVYITPGSGHPSAPSGHVSASVLRTCSAALSTPVLSEAFASAASTVARKRSFRFVSAGCESTVRGLPDGEPEAVRVAAPDDRSFALVPGLPLHAAASSTTMTTAPCASIRWLPPLLCPSTPATTRSPAQRAGFAKHSVSARHRHARCDSAQPGG